MKPADLAWKPDGTQIATAAYGGAAYLAADAAGPHNAAILKGSSLVLAWQPQGRYLAVGNQDETVLFVTAETGETLQMWGFPSKVLAMAWSGLPDTSGMPIERVASRSASSSGGMPFAPTIGRCSLPGLRMSGQRRLVRLRRLRTSE